MPDQRPEPGWYQDPTGRYERRYWTGDDWSEWVLVAGAQQVDRFWDGTHIGGSAGHATSVGGSGASNSSDAATPAPTARRAALRERLGRPRPAASAQSAIAAAAGVAVVLGILVLAGDAADQTAIALLGIVITSVSYGLALVGPEQSRAAGLPGAVVGPVMFVVAALGEVFDGTAQVVVPLLCVAAIWLVMFAAPGFVGAPVLLAGSMLTGWAAIVAAIWGTGTRGPDWFDYGPSVSGTGSVWQDDVYYVDSGPLPFDLQGLTTSTAVFTLLAALGCVIAAGVADRKGWHVLGTPFIATGVVLSFMGLYLAGVAFFGDAELVSFLTTAVGVALLVVGALGERRGSVWIGAATGLSGLISLVVQSFEGQTAGGVALLVVGAVLFAVAPAIERAVRGSRPPAADA